jgi:hypothetical protein
MKFAQDRCDKFTRQTKFCSGSSLPMLFWSAAFAFCSISLAVAQQPAQSSATRPGVSQTPVVAQAVPDNSKPVTPQQKQLADDTAKLLALADELKAELDNSNKDTLSLSVVRKAAEVEKLAHKVRDEIKATAQN